MFAFTADVIENIRIDALQDRMKMLVRSVCAENFRNVKAV
jgi:hypothetical protein